MSFGYLVAFAAALSVTTPDVQIIAHRGASYDAPENTVAAIKLAWQQQADAAEFDADAADSSTDSERR